jgi:hypothetical protein
MLVGTRLLNVEKLLRSLAAGSFKLVVENYCRMEKS